MKSNTLMICSRSASSCFGRQFFDQIEIERKRGAVGLGERPGVGQKIHSVGRAQFWQFGQEQFPGCFIILDAIVAGASRHLISRRDPGRTAWEIDCLGGHQQTGRGSFARDRDR